MSVPSRIHVWPALAGILASLIYALLRRTGIEVNADGWAYWQGAQSIADGMGYRYFSGDPIVAWPPLYSLYLSAWIKLGGSEAFVLILANGVLIFLQGVAWTLLCFLFVKDRLQPGALKYVAVYIALTVALYEGAVLAHNLFYTILPIFIGASWMTIHHEGRREPYIALTCALGIALVESHISGVVYLAATSLMVIVLGTGGLQNRVLSALAILAVPVVALALTAWGLGQLDGHPIEGARFNLIQNLLQVAKGIGFFVLLRSGQSLGWICALLVFAILGLYAFELKTKHLPFVLIFAGFSLSLLGVAFSVTWLNGFVSKSRHLLIFPLLMIPIFVSYLLSSRTPMARMAALFVLMAPLGKTLMPDASVASDDLVPIRASISPIPGFGKTATINGRLLVGPIPWEEPQGGYSPTGAPRWGASQAGAFRAR